MLSNSMLEIAEIKCFKPSQSMVKRVWMRETVQFRKRKKLNIKKKKKKTQPR